MVFHLQRDNARGSLVNARLRQRAVLQRRLQVVNHREHLIGAGWPQQHIVTGVERHNRRLVHAPLLGNALHVQRIRQHHAIIAELLAQDIGHKGV
jgi:hypothetical protein